MIKRLRTVNIKTNPLIISSIRRYYNRIDQYDDLIQEGYEILLSIKFQSNKSAFLGYIKTMLKYHYLNKHKERQFLSLMKYRRWRNRDYRFN